MTISNWDSTINYEKHNVIYRNNSLYFCLVNNKGVDPLINNQENNLINPIWNTSRLFYWRPAYDSPIENIVNLKRFDSPEGLASIQDVKANKNNNDLNLTFDKLSDKEAAAIIVFLESKKGSERFDFIAANPYNIVNKYVCRTWRHSWIFANNNTISTTFEKKF